MPSLFAGIYLQDKPNEFLPLENIDFNSNVNYLKEEIAKKVQCDANNLGKYLRATPADMGFYFIYTNIIICVNVYNL